MFRSKIMFVVVAAALAAVPVGCGDDDSSVTDDNTGGTSGGPDGTAGENDGETLATISGTVTYEGSKEGPLVVSIHTSWPPTMSNVMGFTQVDEPSFPVTYTVEDVTPGSYYVGAYIAVGMFHVGAGPGDPTGVHLGDAGPAPVDVPAEGVTDVDITLMDEE